MRYVIRKIVNGTEYWDTDEKRIIFVRSGAEPDFPVSAEPAHYQDAFKIPELNGLTIKELTEYAKHHDINIPKEVTLRQDIIDYIGDHNG